MASSEADSLLRQVVSPALEKIIKNTSWHKHAKLASECKAVIDRLSNPDKASHPVSLNSEPEASEPGPLHDGGSNEYSLADAESILSPIINAAASGVLKIADPAVDCIQKLIWHGYLRGEANTSGGAEAKLLTKLIESICKCHDLGDDQMELLVLKTLLVQVERESKKIK